MTWLRVGLILAALVLSASCGGGSDDGGSEPAESSGGTVTLDGIPANDHGTKEVRGTAQVEVGDHYFEPTVLVGAPGSTIKLELTNNGSLEHNITSDVPQVDAAYPLDQDIRSGGGTATVEVTFPDSGQLVFLCKYHEGEAMAGALRAKS
jgi:plastocyanin